jgi:predicted  nucleic acid-binding Zn-ribbon protein
MMRVDLGCGPLKMPGFVGVDRFSLPAVDVVLDFDQPLPFASDSVDLVLASHSLEHTADMQFTVGEIYRICKHGAQVCILAPYAHQGVNTANPYHHQAINEHTPRFWTSSPDTLIDPAEYVHPHAGEWGLSESDYSHPALDLRCLRMEFFYFSAYRGLSNEVQRAARKQFLDVCDQMLFHLVVVKQPMSLDELRCRGGQMQYFDPPAIAARRAGERINLQVGQLQQLQSKLEIGEAEIAAAKGVAENLAAQLSGMQLSLQSAEIELKQARVQSHTYQADLAQTRAQLQAQQSESAQTQERLQATQERLQATQEQVRATQERVRATQEQLQATQGQLQATQGQVQATQGQVQATQGQLDDSVAQLQRREAQLNLLESKAKALAQELDLFRGRRLVRWAHRLTLLKRGLEVSPAYKRLLDDCLIFSDVRGYKLQPSVNLQSVAFVVYRLRLDRPGLRGLLLAPVIDIPLGVGRLGLELVTRDNAIVAQAVMPLSNVTEAGPVQLDFSAVASPAPQRFWLRVFVRDASAPVRLLEWQRYRLGGLGPYERRAFCGFVFA